MSESDLTAAEIAAEQRHIDQVYVRLDAARADAAAVEADGHRRAQLGNEGGLFERDVLVYEASRRLRALDVEHDGLVFGRLDMDGGEIRYIGRLGVRDDEFEPLVIDWRAPAAAPFYQATAEARMDVVRRRIIRCSGSRVVGLEDDLLDPSAAGSLPVLGEGALLAALARTTSRSMRDIVATIQREQDEAVRAPASGVTLIAGGPGTGKTAVALHRAAYLLYQDRRRFEASGVLLVGPSGVFIDYIERVLPALGETSVTLRAIGDVLDGVSAVRYDEPAVAAVKGSARMRRVLSRAVRDDPPDAPTTFRVVYGGEVLRLEGADLARVRREVHGRRVLPNAARSEARTAVVEALWQRAMRFEEPPDWSRAAFGSEVRDRGEVRRFLRERWPVLTPAEVLGWLADPARLSRYANGVLRPEEVATLADAFQPETPSIADVALLDELRVLLGEAPVPAGRREPHHAGRPREVTSAIDREPGARAPAERGTDYDEYAHVVVDEAQDISPMQWRMLGRRGRYASWTVVGDPAQSAWVDRAEADIAMDAALSRRPRYEFTLTTNYRNSAEIFALAARVLRRALPDVELPVAVRSTGDTPEHRTAPAAGLADPVRAAVTELTGLVAGTIGVITPMRMRETLRGWMAGFPNRVQTVGSLDAKGMEYDGVVVVEPAAIEGESPVGTRTLYVVLTRATRHLITVSSDPSWQPPE